ncbi:hypothetical protein [Streptomyces sp. TRM68367]|uniref:hypothetical protein n=1 Tax=Streptomyces sp. TRM68367 TaxID=2758415 RepID=UPI00165B7A10|nr:hypothetical protein [Streptomyces sp. TRM68367]MBC9729240.1 hypothetical protein [Streptomyces sp. TRM68367]
MDDVDDLDEWLARLPKRSPREQLAELEAARRADAAARLPEPTTIPMPDFPYMPGHPLAGMVRFSCPLGCGWHHDENPGRDEAAEPLVVPLDPELWEAALVARAEARAEAFRARV